MVALEISDLENKGLNHQRIFNEWLKNHQRIINESSTDHQRMVKEWLENDLVINEIKTV